MPQGRFFTNYDHETWQDSVDAGLAAPVDTAKLVDNAVTTAKIADLAVTTAKIADANVTTAKIADAAATLAKLDRTGALGSVLTGQGPGNLPIWASPLVSGGVVLSTAVTASGASVDYFAIPSTANLVVAMFSGLSNNGTNSVQIQIGPSGGVETTSYSGASSTITSAVATVNLSTGFLFNFGTADTAAATRQGVLFLMRVTGNTWAAFGGAGLSNNNYTSICVGSKTIAGDINRLRYSNAGANVFDAGTVQIGWIP